MKNKQQSLKEPIKRFLLHCVAKAGSQPERLPNELEIGVRFKVSRRTVHSAVADLLQIGYIQHLSGHRGLFSNPAYSSLVPYAIGVVSVCGNCTYLGYYQALVLSSFLSCLTVFKYTLSFMTLCGHPEQADVEIQNSGIDAIFWLLPEPDYYPAISRLLDNDFPVIPVTSLTDFRIPVPSDTYLGMDFRHIGRERAKFFLRHGCRNLVYCGFYGTVYEEFRSVLAAHSVPFLPSHHLPDTEAVLKDLPGLLSHERIDGLVCDGADDQHNQALRILSECPYRNEICILLAIGLDHEQLQKDYTALRLHSLCPNLDRQLFRDIGRVAAQKLSQRLQSNTVRRFSPDLFQWKTEQGG